MFGEAALSYKDTMRRQCRQSGDTHVAEMHGTAEAAFNAAQSTVFPDRMGRNDPFMAIVVRRPLPYRQLDRPAALLMPKPVAQIIARGRPAHKANRIVDACAMCAEHPNWYAARRSAARAIEARSQIVRKQSRLRRLRPRVEAWEGSRVGHIGPQPQYPLVAKPS